MNTKKTIVALKLRASSRTVFEIAVLLKMFFVIGLLFGGMMGCQVYFCKKEVKDTPWTECFKPRVKAKK